MSFFHFQDDFPRISAATIDPKQGDLEPYATRTQPPHTKKHPGIFITLEGGEGVGKTTQAKILHKALSQQGIACYLTRQPGGTSLGTKVRELLFDDQWDPMEELLLILADRHYHMRTVIQPKLNQGEWVICDRYMDSSIVYQGLAVVDQILKQWRNHGIVLDTPGEEVPNNRQNDQPDDRAQRERGGEQNADIENAETLNCINIPTLQAMGLWPWNAAGQWIAPITLHETFSPPPPGRLKKFPSAPKPTSHQQGARSGMYHNSHQGRQNGGAFDPQNHNTDSLNAQNLHTQNSLATPENQQKKEWAVTPLWHRGPTLPQLKKALEDMMVTWIHKVHGYAGILRQPDITFLLRNSVQHSLMRRHKNVASCNKFDYATLSRHYAIERGYRTLAMNNPKRYVMLPQRAHRAEVSKLIIQELCQRFPQH